MDYRPPYRHALAAGAAALALYVATLAPTTWFWDTSEYIATAHILGIPHPPGNPLFVVLGRAWIVLLEWTGLSVAVRINLLAAVTSATATGFMFLAVWRVLRGWTDSDTSLAEAWRRRLPIIGAWAGAILGSTAYTVWNQSNVNEKVYTLSVLVIAVVTWLAIRWRDRKDDPAAGWYLVLAIYLMVLGSTNHLMSLLPAPAFLALVLTEKPQVFLNRRILTRSALALVLGLSFNFFLPLRSEQQPVINEGEPTCDSMVGAAVAIYSNANFGCEALRANLAREQYGKPSIFHDPTSPLYDPEPRSMGLIAHQFVNWFQYFDWQWARGLATSPVPGNSRLPVTLLFLGLGVWALVVTGRSERGHLVYLGTLTATLTVGLVYYLNFKYGYSLAPEVADRGMHEVRERDYFFIAGFHLWGFLAGMGLAGAWRWAAGKTPTRRTLAVAAPVLAVAFVPLVFNWAWADRSDDYSARDWAWNLLQSVEPYGILFTNGDNDTFPLWYLQEVEEIRQDVTVVVVQYLYTDWYPKQLQYHTSPERQRLFEPGEQGGPWEAPPAPPERPLTILTHDQLDSIESGYLQANTTFNLGDVALQFPADMLLGRGERIALAIIRDARGDRPIHFASTGGLAPTLGLEDHAVRQGIAAKLRLGADLEDEWNVVQIDPQLGGEWVDVERTLELVNDVYQYRGLQNREIWADRSTLNIPFQFYYLFMQLGDAVRRTDGESQRVQELQQRAEDFLVTARGGSEGTPSPR